MQLDSYVACSGYIVHMLRVWVCSTFRSIPQQWQLSCLELVPFIIKDCEELAALSIVIHEPRPGPARPKRLTQRLRWDPHEIWFPSIFLGHIRMNHIMISYDPHIFYLHDLILLLGGNLWWPGSRWRCASKHCEQQLPVEPVAMGGMIWNPHFAALFHDELHCGSKATQTWATWWWTRQYNGRVVIQYVSAVEWVLVTDKHEEWEQHPNGFIPKIKKWTPRLNQPSESNGNWHNHKKIGYRLAVSVQAWIGDLPGGIVWNNFVVLHNWGRFQNQ